MPRPQILDPRSDHLAVERTAATRAAAQEYMAAYGREITGLLARMPRWGQGWGGSLIT